MVDLVTGIGLASSILTLAEIGYKISRRTIEFSKLLGELPPDLQECSNLMGILVRAAKRLQAQLEAEGPSIGPITAMHADLESLFNQCNQTASALLSFLDRLKSSDALSKAIRITRKESEILKTRNKLDQYILALLFIFEEHQQEFNEDLRNTAKGLRTDFYQFHQKLVQQISHGFSHIETAINDSRESLLRDVRPLVATTSEAAHTSNLRLLAGQQDLSQNLQRMEHNFASVLQNGEAGLATRFQQQLTEHQAATRTLVQSVYDRNDDMRTQIQLLYREVTKVLAEFDAAQKRSDVGIPNNHLRIKASFEFDIRNHFIALHISQGVEWVSSTVLFPAVKPSTWLDMCIPIPRFDRRHERCNALDMAVRSAPVNFIIRRGINQYLLIKVDLSEKRYHQGISKALDQVYSDVQDPWGWWIHKRPYQMLGLYYVKYGCYSKTMQCFTAVERVSPYSNGDESSAMKSMSPSQLLDRFNYKYASNHTQPYAPPMEEGHALMIKERPDNFMFAFKFVSTCIGFVGALVRHYYTIHRGMDWLLILHQTLDSSLFLLAMYYPGSWRSALRFALPITLVRLLHVLYSVDGEDFKTRFLDSVYALRMHVLSVLFSVVIRLVDKYSIAVEWKEIHRLFQQSYTQRRTIHKEKLQ